jgi:hypothetical protein
VGLNVAVRSASVVLALAVVGSLSGCTGADEGAEGSAAKVSEPAGQVASAPAQIHELRTYLLAWEASWRRLGAELASGDEGALGFSSAPDATWERARRYYADAVAAYRHDERRLVALSAPSTMRDAHTAYLAAVRRQAARFQGLADAFGGSDPYAMERALEALEASQMTFDLDGARWEQAVIAACKASGMVAPKIVRLQLVSNGHRTAGP